MNIFLFLLIINIVLSPPTMLGNEFFTTFSLSLLATLAALFVAMPSPKYDDSFRSELFALFQLALVAVVAFKRQRAITIAFCLISTCLHLASS